LKTELFVSDREYKPCQLRLTFHRFLIFYAYKLRIQTMFSKLLVVIQSQVDQF